MEKEKPFKLFPIPRLNSSQVSAVKPQSFVEKSCYFQGHKTSIGSTRSQNVLKNKTSDSIFQKITHFSVNEEEDTESVSHLYSKLFKEVDKLKKWKFAIESEVNQKAKQLQDYERTIDIQRKAIQELQFENEKLSLKLEDEINDNEDLINQSNATRHVCDLLTDTCARAAEKANMYDTEREDTRQMYGNLNNSIERMIMAFEELRVQAENSRQETYSQIKQETEKRQKLENEYSLKLIRSKQQISELTQEKEDMDKKLLDLKLQLQQSTTKINTLEDASKNHSIELEKATSKAEQLLEQLEEATLSLQNTKDAQKSTEMQLHSVQDLLIQANKEKQTKMEELEKIKALHVLQLEDLQTNIDNLKEMLTSEQTRYKESECSLKIITLEIQKKSLELEKMITIKDNTKTELEELKINLEQTDILRVENADLKKLVGEIQESKKQLQDSLESREEQIHHLTVQKTDLEKLIRDLKETQKMFQDSLESREKEIVGLKTKLNITSEDGESNFKKTAELQTQLDRKELQYVDLQKDYDKLLEEKEKMARHIDITGEDIKNIKRELKSSKEYEYCAKKEIEMLEENNYQLRKEIESLMEQLKEKGEEVKHQLHNCESKTRNIKGEMSKKEKKMKILENKLTSMKKLVEQKNKSLEELRKKNKTIKKKIAEEDKHCNALEAQIKDLQEQLENARLHHEELIGSKKKEIEDAKLREGVISEEVEKLKTAANEAIKLQKETDMRCQHKIAEIVALMEKHKHQYDKTVEEKDAELDCYRTREQDITSTKVVLRTHTNQEQAAAQRKDGEKAVTSVELKEIDLSNAKDEIAFLREQLKQQIQEKENIAKKAEEASISQRKEMKHKKVQTSIMDTPKQATQKIDIQNQISSSKKSHLAEIASHLGGIKQSDNRNTSPWTSSRSTMCTLQKTYSVKTPPKSEALQCEKANPPPSDSANKKRRVALEFDFHSDSSEHTDILGIRDDEIFKKLYQKCPRAPSVCTMTAKTIFPEKLLTSPSSALKTEAIKKMREAGWAAVSKVDRRRRMKAAEKLFN